MVITISYNIKTFLFSPTQQQYLQCDFDSHFGISYFFLRIIKKYKEIFERNKTPQDSMSE